MDRVQLKFVSDEDSMLSMLKWLCEKLMKAEAEAKLATDKSERVSNRQGYWLEYRDRRFDTRRGRMYLMVSKIRNGANKCYPRNLCQRCIYQENRKINPNPGY